MEPVDQAQRLRFASELDRNFSVVAAAGSGKTHAITDRIVELARSPRARERLPQLVVVTFTNRSADEMQQRARQRLLESGVSLEIVEAFHRAFFGTIHSFCLKLLRAHGHIFGLPSQPELVRDDRSLWREFVLRQTVIGRNLEPAHRLRLFRHVLVTSVMALGRDSKIIDYQPTPLVEPPAVDLSQLLNHAAKRSNIQGNLDRTKRAAAEWERVMTETDDFAPLPEMFGESNEIRGIWEPTFAPLREWIQRAALQVGAEVARQYREFRIERGALTFDDQVALALELFDNADVAARIREENYRVILDEAQDTDPTQFGVLLETSRPPEATGQWPQSGEPPRPGHFCMVGDFQQSIYGNRAGLQFYRQLHTALTSDSVGESISFSVTFRLDTAGVNFANAAFPSVLSGENGQVSFVPLSGRPEVLPGQVIRLEAPKGEFTNDNERAWHEAVWLAHWIKQTGFEPLRATQWSDVALICPRKGWFYALRGALRRIGVSAQIQSERELRGDHPSVAWFTALVVIMAEPGNGFELAGVLREVFGLSDHDLAVYANGEGARLQLSDPPVGSGPVAERLRQLYALRLRLRERPLLGQIREIVAVTQLRERLLSLPADSYDRLDSQLDEMLMSAAVAEAAGLTLPQFADELREDFATVREPRVLDPNAIQIITGHKSKGSEWPVVIVPMLGRKVWGAPISYPLVVREFDGKLRVAFSKADLPGSVNDAIKLRAQQEAERLLYVSLTRARHSLVIIDDRALFEGSAGSSGTSQAQVLRLDASGGNTPALAKLPMQAVICTETRAHQSARRDKADESRVIELPPGSIDSLPAARDRADVFVKRNPSTLVDFALKDVDRTKLLDPEEFALMAEDTAQRYGVWWHGLVERIDWSAPAEEWDRVFGVMQPHSPDPKRSESEWGMLKKTLPGVSALNRPGLQFHTELPFLWRMNDRECMEGFIDLAVCNPASGDWFILDWKTNRIPAESTEALWHHYLPQLAAYRAALTAMLNVQASAAIYSTCTGAWLAYDEQSLDRCWQEISVQPEKLAAALLA